MPWECTPLPVRFERHVQRQAENGCWLWLGAANQAGYGQFRIGRKGPVLLVHRWAFEHFSGTQIPAGKLVLHHCDNPRCVNPAHLYVGTHKDNARDAIVRGRRAKTLAFTPRHAKLTDDDVRAIRIDERTGAQIAAAFKISETHVSQIRNRTRKGHVADAENITTGD